MNPYASEQSCKTFLEWELKRWRREVKDYLLIYFPIILCVMVVATFAVGGIIYYFAGKEVFYGTAHILVLLLPALLLPPMWETFPRKPTLHTVRMRLISKENDFCSDKQPSK